MDSFQKISVFLFVLIFPILGNSQDLNQFNQDRIKLDQRLMLTLGSWSLANVAVSSVGWATTNGEARSFHQMNVMWSGVNLALAIPGYLRARKEYGNTYSFSESVRAQQKTEKVFLFNTALDLAYVTGGFYFRQRALSDPENAEQLRGWGNSIILQGGFLFLFDLTAVLLHANHRKKTLDSWMDNVELSSTGLGIKYTF